MTVGSRVCGAGIRTDGQGCTTDEQCASGRCVEGGCSPIGDAGPSDRGPDQIGSPDGGVGDSPTDMGAADAPADSGVDDVGLDVSNDQAADEGSSLFVWVMHAGASGVDRCNGVAIDDNDNVVLTGSFAGSVDFGGGALSSAGGSDIFVASYDSAGNLNWSKRIGGTLDDAGYQIAVEGGGNVVVVGSFAGTADFESGPLTSAGDQDIFVARFDVTGQPSWTNQYGGPLADVARGIAATAAGAVVVTGYFSDAVRFGKGSPVSSAGGSDIFVMHLDSAGGEDWTLPLGGSGNDRGNDLAVDSNGFVVVTGSFEGTVDFGGGALVSAGSNDIFLARYDSLGAHQWSKRFGASGVELDTAVAVDASGHVALAGSLWPPGFSIGGSVLPSVDMWDIFVGKFDSAGQHLWSRRFGGSYSDVATDVAFDSAGTLYLTGYFSGPLDFGFGTLQAVGYDAFLAPLDAGGTPLWALRSGWTGQQRSYSVAVGSSGRIAFGGAFYDIGIVGEQQVTSAGASDIFLDVMNPPSAP